MAVISATEIPSLSLLYKLKKLSSAVAEKDEKLELPSPSQSFNDRIGLIRGDITKLEVDAIVNAANTSLLGGGGVDGAIHNAAGDELYEECKTLSGCDTGSAKITKGYKLPSKNVIHAVGPIYRWGAPERSAELLAGCYSTSLQLAVQNQCKSIVFSALSTGIYGYPSEAAAPVAIRAVKKFLEGEYGDKLEKVVFCTFVQKDVDAYDFWLPRLFPPTDAVAPTEIVTSDEPAAASVTPTKSATSTDPVTATDAEPESDWENVEAGESAENGPAPVPEASDETIEDEVMVDEPAAEEPEAMETEGVESEDGLLKVDMPSVPTTKPVEDGPASKKQRTDAE